MRNATRLISLAAIFIAFLFPMVGHAQLGGHNSKGDFGVLAGTQAPPGFYIAPMLYNYSADTARDKNGDKFAPLGGGGDIEANAGIVGLMWVTDKKILGGNYSFSVWPAYTNNTLQLPILEDDIKSGTGLADLYVRPIDLGWHTDRADFVAGIGVFAPTGDFDADSDTNRGLGMWSYELFGGTTVYFDEAKTWHFATVAAYETHGKKDGTDMRVGDILTLEGGFGKSFMEGALSVGVAYYAQWKMTNDDFGFDFSPPAGPLIGKHKVYGFGPDITIPLASKKKLYGFLNIRYFWESGARTTLEGDTFVVTFSFPVPSIPLQ
jgi:hypothetical protein